jgi:hypothetical protein
LADWEATEVQTDNTLPREEAQSGVSVSTTLHKGELRITQALERLLIKPILSTFPLLSPLAAAGLSLVLETLLLFAQ